MKTCTYQLCKRQSAHTSVLIGRYRLSANYQCISNNYYRTEYITYILMLSEHHMVKDLTPYCAGFVVLSYDVCCAVCVYVCVMSGVITGSWVVNGRRR